jgi:prepilin-type processing-associated H-X9-DG protein
MKRFLTAALALVVTSAALAQQPGEKSGARPELAAIPNDAFAFAHVKLADLWRNDALKDVRVILEKAGPKAIEAFDKRFTPAPSTIERLSVYMPAPNFEAGRPEFDFVFLLALSQPFDQARFLKQLGKTSTHKGRNGDFLVDEEESVAVRFLGDRTLAFGTISGVQHMVDNAPPKKAGPLTPALELAAGPRPIVASLNVSALPPDFLAGGLRNLEVPEPLHPLFKARSVTLSLDLDGNGNIHALASYPDAKAADAAEHAVGVATDMAKSLIADTRKQLADTVFAEGKAAKIEDLPEAAVSLLGLGALQHAEDILNTKPVKRSGDALSATIPLPPHFKSAFGTAAVAGSMMAPAVGRLKDAATRQRSANNLKQIGLALHNYHDVNNTLPAAAVVDKKGKPMLSWRVMILPYIEQDELYKQFHLDEPWDSDHNKKLIEKMPPTYALPVKGSKPGHTHYRVFVGNGAMWDWVQGTTLAQITDGLSNTWMVVEAEDGVPWTKPDELEFDPTKDLPKLGKAFKGGFNVLYGDGSVRFYKTVPKSAKAMITMAGGEVIVDER